MVLEQVLWIMMGLSLSMLNTCLAKIVTREGRVKVFYIAKRYMTWTLYKCHGVISSLKASFESELGPWTFTLPSIYFVRK
jgi:hypothetical protein